MTAGQVTSQQREPGWIYPGPHPGRRVARTAANQSKRKKIAITCVHLMNQPTHCERASKADVTLRDVSPFCGLFAIGLRFGRDRVFEFYEFQNDHVLSLLDWRLTCWLQRARYTEWAKKLHTVFIAITLSTDLVQAKLLQRKPRAVIWPTL